MAIIKNDILTFFNKVINNSVFPEIAAVTIPTAPRVFYLGARFTTPTATEDNNWTNLKEKILAITPAVSTTYPAWVIRDSASDGTIASFGTDTVASLAAIGIYAYSQKDWLDLIATKTAPTLKTNGTNNTSQSVLNLIAGANVILVSDGAGGVTIAGMNVFQVLFNDDGSTGVYVA